MKPVVGVISEVAALTAVLAAAPYVPSGAPFGLYVVLAQLAGTYLVHCPVHYVAGSFVRIRFRRILLGRTTLSRVLPERLAALARLIPIVTLVTDKGSLAGVSKIRIAAMYASGTVASASLALVIALAATLTEPFAFAAIAWVVAIAYLGFDLVFSPRSGDFARAGQALRQLKT